MSVYKISIEGNCLVDVIKEVNKWLEPGKIVKSINIDVNDSKYYSHKAIIETVDIARGKNGTIKNDSHKTRCKRKTDSKN